MISISTTLEQHMQTERMARAQAALLQGAMSISRLDACAWLVASKGHHYLVTLDGDAWACNCPDFEERCQRFGLRCKHIEAIRIAGTAQIAELPASHRNPFSHTEEPMTLTTPPLALPVREIHSQALQTRPTGDNAPTTDEIVRRLQQPLAMERVKRRQAPGLGSVPYLEGYDVIETANELFLFRWSFDLLNEPKIMRWDKVITFYDQRAKKKVPVLDEDGKPATEIAGVVYVTGRITIELNGKSYSHADVGRCTFGGDTPEALDTALAGATTDCLKRCFRQLGEQFGNSLYDKEIAKTAGMENGTSGAPVAARNGSLDPQAAPQPAPPASAPMPPASPDLLHYQDGMAVDVSNAAEMSAFQAFKLAHPGLQPASREALRTWAANHHPNGKK